MTLRLRHPLTGVPVTPIIGLGYADGRPVMIRDHLPALHRIRRMLASDDPAVITHALPVVRQEIEALIEIMER